VFSAVVSHPLAKLLLLGLLWAYLHHFCAGIRFLLLDMHKGVELQAARSSARIVLIVSLVLTVIIGVTLW
jgi:succinate dehydrogenase / fumarate reductase cytochrome b subunit